MSNDSSFDHSMAPASEDFRINLKDLTEENRKKVRALQDCAKTIRKAPPPSIKNTEERVSLRRIRVITFVLFDYKQPRNKIQSLKLQ